MSDNRMAMFATKKATAAEVLEDVPTSTTQTASAIPTAAATNEALVPVVKRPRGRPRKHPLVPTAAQPAPAAAATAAPVPDRTAAVNTEVKTVAAPLSTHRRRG